MVIIVIFSFFNKVLKADMAENGVFLENSAAIPNERRTRFAARINRIMSSSRVEEGAVFLNDERKGIKNYFRKRGGTKVVLLENRIPLMALYQVKNYYIIMDIIIIEL